LTQDIATGAISADSVRTAIAAIFHHSEYHRSLRGAFWQQILNWMADLTRAIVSALRRSPSLGWGIVAVLALVVGMVIARAAYVRRARRSAPRALGAVGRSTGRQDPWTMAHSEALAGRYLEAAHALYLAIIESLGRTDRVVVDSAKTVGDYSRELRRAGSGSLSLYRAFARAYEPIVWGSRDCDARSYEHLAEIAVQLAKR
jgi:hypothetical protein